jgi:acid stress-induced BolA-like protein IbaG/YrbA
MRDDRSEYTSKKDIKKVLNNCLEETNWHVMAEGVDYKLGILKGRLRGQESKEDIYDGLKNS